MDELSDELYVRFREWLRASYGFDYPERKRADLSHSLGLALSSAGVVSLEELYGAAVAGGQATEAVLAQLTIGETFFFRNMAQFAALRDKILPELCERRRMTRNLRIWSAGCATGEEPYSLAMLFADALPASEGWQVSILATDINPHFLARARDASYSAWSFRETLPELRERFFSAEGGRWRLHPEIRRMVTFARLNLAEASYPAIANGTCALDIILCRNVTIYFDEPTTRQVAERFYGALTPGGWLVVGHSEPQISTYRQFETHNFPDTVVYRKPLDAPLFAFDPAQGTFSAGSSPLLYPKIQPAPSTRAPGTPLPQTRPLVGPPALQPVPAIRPQTRPLVGPPALQPVPAIRPSTGPLAERLPASTPAVAARAAQPALSPSPDRWPAIRLRLARGDKLVAEALLRELLDAEPTSVEALIMLARLCADRGSWSDAEAYCTLALGASPLLVGAHYLLGQVYENQGRLDEALAAYRSATFLDRSFVLGILAMADVWRQMERPSEAQRAYRGAIRQLESLPRTTVFPDADDASAADLIALANRQLQSIE